MKYFCNSLYMGNYKFTLIALLQKILYGLRLADDWNGQMKCLVLYIECFLISLQVVIRNHAIFA